VSGPRRRIVAATLIALAGMGGLVPCAQSARVPPTISVDSRHPGRPIPADFLGLSFEVKAIARIGSYAHRGNLVALMRTLGSGMIRFGGVTADTQAAWTPPGSQLPRWATTPVTPADLRAVADLNRATGWPVALTVNLGHFDPAAAASEARSAQSALGPGLAAIELGNEPNSYVGKRLRERPWGFEQYLPQAQRYRQEINAAAPGVAIAGPGASTGPAQDSWASSDGAAFVPALLTAHYYPLSHCADFPPVIADLVSTSTRRRERQSIARIAGTAADTTLPLRLDEVNNVSCGGQAGVSETFASALSAVDIVTMAMSAGLRGINFHGAVENPHGYAPIAACRPGALLSGTLCAQPEYYGLLLTSLLEGDRPLATASRGTPASLSAAAFLRPSGGLHVVLIDHRSDRGRTRRIALRLPRGLGPGTVLRLTAPSLGAQAGVRLGGRSVDDAGRWSAPRTPSPIRVRAGQASVTLRAASAALLTFPAAGGARSRTRR